MKRMLILIGTVVLCSTVTLIAGTFTSLQQIPEIEFQKTDKRGFITHLEGQLTQETPRGNEVSEAFAFLSFHQQAFNLTSPVDELQIESIQTDRMGYTHLKMRQMYHDIPVINGQIFTHFNRNNIIKTVNGNIVPDISIDPSPVITSYEATNAGLDDLQSFFGTGTPDNPELVIFPWEGEIYLSWRFYIYSETPMGRWEYFIDAKTNEVIFKANRIMHSDEIGTGIGVMGNIYDHIDTEFDGTEYRLIDNTRRANNDIHGHGGLMGPANSIRTSIASNSLPGNIATDDDNVWSTGPQSAAIDGHIYTGLFYDWMLAEMGRNSYTDNGATMHVTVEYTGEGTNNAYWNGSRIVVWGASPGWRSLAGAPDVIAHEWGHAVTDYTSDLVYQKEPGALNESFSDMLGAAFEFAHPTYDTPDWYMGENGLVSGNGFRSMSNPHQYGDPDTYGTGDQYWIDVENCTPTYLNDWCGVHTNSGVGNKWFFLLSDGGVHNGVTVQGIGVENAILIAYRANQLYWTSNSTYHEAALGTISAANDLDSTYAWTVQTSKAWAAVGIDAPNPEIGFEADTTWGWVPLSVEFSGNSVLNVQKWDWEFGDGVTADVQSPVHVYNSSGLFDVTLEIEADGDIKTFTQPEFIIALADTVKTESYEALAGETVEVILRMRNSIPVNDLIIPLVYAGDFTMSVDSFSTAGCRTEYFETQAPLHYDPFNRRFTYRLKTNSLDGTPDLPGGYGDILKIYFTIPGSAQPGQSAAIDLSGYNDYYPSFEAPQLQFEAAQISGAVAIPDCLLRGDVTNNGEVDIADLVAFVEYSFNSGPAPSPIELADVNCDGFIDIEDIVYLVAFMFSGGPPPCEC